jgi:hypothetical protein
LISIIIFKQILFIFNKYKELFLDHECLCTLIVIHKNYIP